MAWLIWARVGDISSLPPLLGLPPWSEPNRVAACGVTARSKNTDRQSDRTNSSWTLKLVSINESCTAISRTRTSVDDFEAVGASQSNRFQQPLTSSPQQVQYQPIASYKFR